MKRRLWPVTIYLLIALGVGLWAALNMPAFHMAVLAVFAVLLIIAVLIGGGLLMQGAKYFISEILPLFMSKSIHLLTGVRPVKSRRDAWLVILSLLLLAILLFVQSPEIRPLMVGVLVVVCAFGAPFVVIFTGPRLNRIAGWVERTITDRTNPLATLFLELSYNARFYTPRHEYAKVMLTPPDTDKANWRTSVVGVLPDYLGIYPLTFTMNEAFTFRPEQLLWLGRLRRFNDTESELWLDVEVDSRWYTVRIRMKKAQMKHLYDALRAFLSSELGTIRNLQRPNIRQQPVEAKTVSKGEAVQLYLTPLHLVILREGNVQRAIPLDQIEQVSVSNASSLVEFVAEGRKHAFTLEGYEKFADALATATRYTPETGRHIEGEEDYVLDDEDFVIGDDGEIRRSEAR